MDIQKQADVLEQMLERDIKEKFLTTSEFHALNTVLLHLQLTGEHVIHPPDRSRIKNL